MAWTAEKVKEMRESNPSKAAESSGWTAEKVRAIRTKTPNPSAASSTVPPKSNIYADALQRYTERHISDMGEVDARNEPSQALRASSPRVGNGDDRRQWRIEGGAVGAAASRMQATAKQTLGAATRAQSATGVSGKFPLDAGSSVGRKMAGAATGNSGSGPARQMPEAAARALDMGQKWGVPAKSGNMLENVGSGAMAYGSGRAQELRASFAKDSVPDEFDRINQSGAIHKVMEQVRQMLDGLISRAKEVLTIDPDDRAALKAKRLAEAEKRTLQDEYFAHAEKAMDNLRTAKENAAALKTESAAEKQGARFKLGEGEETLEKQLNRSLKELDEMKPVAQITGEEVQYGKTGKENTENIVRFFESIGGKVTREGFGTVELVRAGAKATVQHGNGQVKQIAVAAIPDVIRYGKQIGFAEDWKNRGYNTYVFAAPVSVKNTEIYEAVIVKAYPTQNSASKFYVHEVCGSDGSLLSIENGTITKKESGLTSVLKTEQGGEAPKPLSKNSIAQPSGESKRTDEAVKKTVRFQLSAPVEVERTKELVAVHKHADEGHGPGDEGGENGLHRYHPLTYSTGSYSPGCRYAPSRSCGWGAWRLSGSARCRPGRAAGSRRRRPRWPRPRPQRKSLPPGPEGAGSTCCRPRRHCGRQCGSRW